MKTDDLIAMLSTNTEVVDRSYILRMLTTAVVAGAFVAVGGALVGLGLRTDLIKANAFIFLLAKLVFAIWVIGIAAVHLMRLARPGAELKTPFILPALPFIAIALLAAVSLGTAPSAHWEMMIVGEQWVECLFSIPIIAIAPFALVVWAVRQTAPTDLVRAGTFSGLVAGGISAMAYAFHCMDDSLPFVAVWYGGATVLCTMAGAALGPKLLRW